MVRNGTVYNGSGSDGVVADVAVAGDTIVGIGEGLQADGGVDGAVVVDATGLAVAPGFVNPLSHSYASMLADGRSLGELTQGVTTQVFGEGQSMGPLTPAMAERMRARQGLLRFDVCWSRLSEYLAHVEARGTSQNVASFIGATTLRIHAVGYEDRPATARELDLMGGLVREEMADGALGIGSALIYPPGVFASTRELVELCREAGRHGGSYSSHLRSEGDRLLEGVEELLHIAREAEVPALIHHLKAAGRGNWPKLDPAVDLVERARASGAAITADVYPYTAGATALAATIPPWFHDGGLERLQERLADGAMRAAMRAAIESSSDGWENLHQAAGGADGVLLLSVRDEERHHWQGRTLAEVAEAEGVDPIEALFDLVLVDGAQATAAYFIISEDNLRRELVLPWVSFGSDAASMAAEGVFLASSTHPRSYGTFARMLGRYVREEKLLSLPAAVRRLTRLPADSLGLHRRGRLEPGYFADIVVFDPGAVADRATYRDPHRYSVGVRDVIVNGQLTLRDGQFTGTLAGRVLHGPGR